MIRIADYGPDESIRSKTELLQQSIIWIPQMYPQPRMTKKPHNCYNKSRLTIPRQQSGLKLI